MELVKWNKARQAIIEAKSIDEVKEIKDKAEVMRAYSKQIGESLEVQNNICEIKLRAERRMGEMLKEMPKQAGARGVGKGVGLHDVTPLKDIGIEKHQSSRYQKIAELPEEKFEEIIEETKAAEKELTESLLLDTAKKIDRATKIQEQREGIEKGTLKLPEGVFEVIVIDPPWRYQDEDSFDPKNFRGLTSYPTMSIEEIKNIKLPAAKNCILWLWTTHRFMRYAFKLLDEWGFEEKVILTWCKNRMGIGKWLRSNTEFCIMAVRGKPLIELTNQTTTLNASITKHSEKPESFYQMVNKLCVGRKLDYFARKKREGWEVYGDEV